MLTPIVLTLSLVAGASQDTALTFERIQLSDAFFGEGASFADLDRDGHGDVISGPYWYAGPDFTEKRAIYAAHAFDPKGYSDNFFCHPRDFDEDGWIDVLFVGFPDVSRSAPRTEKTDRDWLPRTTKADCPANTAPLATRRGA